jgi:hypothetical protein
MIGDQQERGLAAGIGDRDWRRLVGRQQGFRRLGHRHPPPRDKDVQYLAQ